MGWGLLPILLFLNICKLFGIYSYPWQRSISVDTKNKNKQGFKEFDTHLPKPPGKPLG